MRVLMKPVKMIAWFDDKGVVTPVKFKIDIEQDESTAIKVDNIIIRDQEKLAGNKMFIYRCQSIIDGVEKTFELKYEVNTCKWYLYKI